MIRGFALAHGGLRELERPLEAMDQVVWLDLLDASEDEVARVEDLVEFNVPTREEMDEIEVSSRLYQESDAVFLTITLPARAGKGEPQMAPVGFVLADWLLVTVRRTEPRAFTTFPKRATGSDIGLDNSSEVLLALLDAIVDRLADLLEQVSHEIDATSKAVFSRAGARPAVRSSFRDVLQQLGRQGDLLSDLRESLMTIGRAVGYLQVAGPGGKRLPAGAQERLVTMARDVQSISEHASFMTQKVTFLLDAMLGLISIEQNATIKIFSVLAVIFMPPTMIASIYGMNFARMPELQWPWGYPFALLLMLAAAVLPYAIFKRKGWL